jgi:hypothetical protein
MRPFTISIILAGLLSCTDSVGPTGLRLRLDVDRNVVALDDSVAITLTATNATRRSLTVFAPESYGVCMHAFRVFDATQREVNVETFLCALITIIGPRPIELAPGASVTARDYWKPGTSTLDGQAIPSGTYRLFGHYHAEQSVVLSAPEQITLVP